MKRVNGIAASQGVAIGPAFVYRPEPLAFKKQIVENPPAEINRLLQAVKAVQTMLIALEEHTHQAIGEQEAKIFEVHRMFLADPAFSGEIEAVIQEERLNAEAAVDRVSNTLMAEFNAIDDEYFRQRAIDIKDVAQRLIRQLLGLEETTLASLKQQSVIIAHDLTPSDTAALNRQMALGLCTEIGSSTSHTAILARSLGIPAVVGAGKLQRKGGVR